MDGRNCRIAPIRLAVPDDPPAIAVLADPVILPDAGAIALAPALSRPGGDLDIAGTRPFAVIVPGRGKIRALEPLHLEETVERGIRGEGATGRRPPLRPRCDAAESGAIAGIAGNEGLDGADR